MKLRPARIVTAVTFSVLGVSLLFPNYAPGDPIGDLKAKAKALEDQIESNGTKVAALGEQINAVQIKVSDADAKIADADARTREAEAKTARLRNLIKDRAAAIYRNAGTNGPFAAFEAQDATEATARVKYSSAATSQDNQLIDELGAAKEDLGVIRSEAESARKQAQDQKAKLDAIKEEAKAAAAHEAGLLGQVKGQIGDLVRQEQQRRAAAAAAKPPTVSASKANQHWDGPVPNASGGAGAAVAFAQAQVGKPYCYAGAGPDCFDCSGLTMRAWQAGGLSLPHFSGAQGSMFPRVPVSQLQPGDLITTSSWGAHVGIWVGGGYVHATHTGDFIKFVGGSGSVVDAVRPG